jgi:hypothetical protein
MSVFGCLFAELKINEVVFISNYSFSGGTIVVMNGKIWNSLGIL